MNLREQGHGHRRDIHHIPSDGMARATQLRRLEQPLRQQIQRPQGHKPTKEINKSLPSHSIRLLFQHPNPNLGTTYKETSKACMKALKMNMVKQIHFVYDVREYITNSRKPHVQKELA